MIYDETTVIVTSFVQLNVKILSHFFFSRLPSSHSSSLCAIKDIAEN